jgi:hypothetical protein
VTSGSLEEGGVSVMVNGATIGTDMTTTLQPMEMTDIQLMTNSTTSTGFRGFLIRVGIAEEEGAEGSAARQASTDLSSVLSVSEEAASIMQMNQLCPLQNAVGLTHTNNEPKMSVTGTMETPETAMDLTLDVTVVMQNRDGVAEHYYTRYMMSVAGGEEMDEEQGDNSTMENGEAENDSSAFSILSTAGLGLLGTGVLATMM